MAHPKKEKIVVLIIGFFFINFVHAKDCVSSQWITGEYLHVWIQNSPVGVPLVTASNNPTSLSIIGQPGTQILFGAGARKNSFGFHNLTGLRISTGAWIEGTHCYGIEGIGFLIPKKTSIFSASSITGDYAATNIPFFATQTNSENVLVNRHPNTATVKDSFKSFGAELNGLTEFNSPSPVPVIFSLGVKYFNVSENFTLNDAITELVANSIVNVQDNFSTRNNFLGLLLGARTKFNIDQFCLDVGASVAAGNNFQKLIINGQVNVNNNTVIQPIGLFAEPTNIGRFKKNQFAFLPEFRAKLHYCFNGVFRVFVGYNILYISKVIRPGNQIDRVINQSQNPSLGGTGLVGPARPKPLFKNNSMWIQNASMGIEYLF